ncbi:MAG: pirin family protein [Desulfofustis sp.]|nr:pirin family protein [Desulfofustis sp.]
MERSVARIISASPVIEGAGVHLNRVFGFSEVELFDPFLLLDDFRSDTPAHYLKGFPWHPHRGIETITYVLKGNVEHGDSLGNSGVISSGDVQWMTAGSGIVHQEMPKGDDQGAMHGFQLWANLPARHKMTAPRYQEITAAQIPEVSVEGARVKVIAGELGAARGPVSDIFTDPEYLDVSLPAHGCFQRTLPADHTVLLYAIDGGGTAAASTLSNRQLLLYGPGDEVLVRAGPEGIRFLLLSGKPLHEPIAWRGPVVMNTQEELETAFREYREGTFIK